MISHIPADILRHGRIDAKAIDRIRRLVGQRYASLGETVTLGPRGKRRWHDRPRLGNVTKRQLLSNWIVGKMNLVAPPAVGCPQAMTVGGDERLKVRDRRNDI